MDLPSQRLPLREILCLGTNEGEKSYQVFRIRDKEKHKVMFVFHPHKGTMYFVSMFLYGVEGRGGEIKRFPIPTELLLKCTD